MERTLIYERNKQKDKSNSMEFCFTNQDVVNYFNSFPGVSESILIFTNNLNNYITYILNNFRVDLKEVTKKFKIKHPFINSIHLGDGDSHCGGKSVAIISFADCKILFKPVPADTLEAYTKILSLFNREAGSKLYCLSFINKQEYHWCEFVENISCNNIDDVMDFYHDIGTQLAILYMFNGTDFHHENIIAYGKYPVFIDMECLFSMSCPPGEMLSNSVLATRVIPPLSKKKYSKYISAISGIDNIGYATVGQFIEKEGLFFYEKIRAKINQKNNIPHINGVFYMSYDYKDSILKGFESGYEFFIKNKFDILTLLHVDFRGYRYRKVIKPTFFYYELLSMSTHPVFNTSLSDRRAFFTILFAQNEINDTEIEHCKDMFLGDVPLHYLVLSETDIFMPRSALSNITNKILNSNVEELNFQKKLISLSVDCLKPKISDFNKNKHMQITKPPSGLAKVEYIFDKILKSDFKSERFSLCKEDDSCIITQLKEGLYNGMGGMSFLSLCLYTSTRKRKYFTIAKNITMEQLSKPIEKGGVFNGRGTSIYILQLMYQLTRERKYINKAILELHKTLNFKKKNESNSYDFLFGYAGCLTLCANILNLNITNVPLVTPLFRAYLNEIINNKKDDKLPSTNGCYWGEGLTGFSHGNAGILYALSQINDHFNDEFVSDVIHSALRYEDKFKYDGGWKDLRNSSEDGSDAGGWCNGGPGIFLSRAMSMPHIPSAYKQVDEFNMDLYKDGKNIHSICHGMIGNALIDFSINGSSDSRNFINNEFNSICLDAFDKSLTEYNLDISLMNGILGLCYAYVYANFQNTALVMRLGLFKG